MFKTMCKKTAAFFMALMLVVSYASFNFQPLNASAAEIVDQPNAFKTTLKDRTTKSDRLTFDIWARDKNGQKLSADTIKVTNNGKSVGINWDDSEKTSYTLYLSTGENKIKIIVTGDIKTEKDFSIIKLPAEDGENIGDYVMSLDGFTVGLGYIIEPTRMPIYKGQNAAMLLVDQLDKHGFTYTKTGTVESSFYLASITKKEGSIYDVGVKIPEEIDDLGLNVDPDDHEESLGEFDFNYMSGWMYKLNNVFPNVGFADSYLQADDVMAVQFTVGYGSDLGGGWDLEFFPVINRDEITRQLAYINSAGELKAKFLADPAIKEAYDHQMEIMAKFGLEQTVINDAEDKMNKAIAAYVNPYLAKIPEKLTANDLDSFLEVKNIINNTTEKERLQFDNMDKFNNANTRYESFIEVEKLEKLIAEVSLDDLNVKEHFSSVSNISSRFRLLGEEFQGYVSNSENLVKFENKMENLVSEYIQNIDSDISKLPSIEDLALTDEQTLIQIREKINVLDQTEKEKIVKMNLFISLEEKMVELINKKRVADVIILIDKIPTIEKLQLSDKEYIDSVNTAYNKLEKELQNEVTNYSKLTDSQYRIKWFEKAQAVVKSIDSIPELSTFKVNDFSKVTNTTNSYKNLDDEQKKLVTNYSKLTAAQERVVQLQPAKTVIDIFGKLPYEYSLKLTDEPKIIEARKAYNELSDELKTYVDNLGRLTKIEIKLQSLKEAEIIDHIEKLIAKLPSEEQITATNWSEIVQIRVEFDKLSDAAKSKVKTAKVFIATEKVALTKVVSKITNETNELPIITELTLKNSKSIQENFELMQLLNEEQLKGISNETIEKLKSSNERINQLLQSELKVKEVIELINALPNEKDVQIANEAKIKEAKSKFDSLTSEEQALVTNSSLLPTLLTKITKLKDEIEAFNKQTHLLPKANKVTLQDEKKINQALKAYEKLTEEQKNLVYKLDLNNLLEAKKRLVELIAQAEVDEVIRLINELPSPTKLTLKDEELVSNTLAQFNELTKEQKSLVTNKANLELLATTLENLKLYEFNDQINRVNELIELLPDFTNVDVTTEKQVELIIEKYNALQKEQQDSIKGYEKVTQYTQKIQMLKTKAVEVFEQIAKLPEANAVKVTDRQAVENARTAFSNLTIGQKSLVTNASKLDQVEKALAQLESKTVLELVVGILSLPEASEATEAVQGEVLSLRAKYNQLSKPQQEMITNYKKLVKVEEKLKTLAEINSAKAEKVISLIAKIPSIITLENQEQIEDARAAYEGLTVPQQSVVTNYELLANAEELLLPLVEEEQKAAYKVTSMISGLPSKITTDHEAAVNSVRKAFNGLTTSQKKLVKNEAVLEDAEKTIKKLQNVVMITSKNAKMTIPTITNLSTSLSGTASKTTKVYVYNGSKRLGYDTVSSTGKYSMKIAKQKKGTKLKFVLRNSDKKVVKTSYVTVKAATVKTPYSVKASTTKVTGKASKAKTVAIYKGSKKVGTAKVKSNGTFIAKITKQKKKTKLSVYAYDSVKNRSSKKVVSVK